MTTFYKCIKGKGRIKIARIAEKINSNQVPDAAAWKKNVLSMIK